MLRLLKDHIARIVVLSRIERTYVIAMAIKEMQDYLILLQEFQNPFVEVYFPKYEYVPNSVNRKVFQIFLAFNADGVVFATQSSI